MRLHDRVFLLLGGTGGIGKALVEPLVRAGARVIIASRHPEKLEHREGVSLAHLDLSAPDLDQQLAMPIRTLMALSTVPGRTGLPAWATWLSVTWTHRSPSISGQR